MKVKFAEGIMSVSEAAALRGVSQTAIRSAIKSGRLPAVRGAGRVGVRSSDVIACAFRNKVQKSP